MCTAFWGSLFWPTLYIATAKSLKQNVAKIRNRLIIINNINDLNLLHRLAFGFSYAISLFCGSRQYFFTLSLIQLLCRDWKIVKSTMRNELTELALLQQQITLQQIILSPRYTHDGGNQSQDGPHKTCHFIFKITFAIWSDFNNPFHWNCIKTGSNRSIVVTAFTHDVHWCLEYKLYTSISMLELEVGKRGRIWIVNGLQYN